MASVESGKCNGERTVLHLPGGDFSGSYDTTTGEVSIGGQVNLLGDGSLRTSVFEEDLKAQRNWGQSARREHVSPLNQSVL